MPFATAAEFLDALRQLHLVSPEQLEQLRQISPAPNPDPRALAGELIQRGWLTAYQGNQLLQGHGSELLLGSYVLLERLGEGGMGTVFKARNWKLGQIVALKLIRKERLDSAAAVTRFQREIRACARLNHPHIVRAFDADEVAGTHLLVMELVDGSDLGKLVKESGPLPVAQACEYIRQAALGLQHAHEHGLIHRDIKPSNLLVTSASGGRKPPEDAPGTSGASSGGLRPPLADGVIKILDLGLARMTHTPSEDSPSTLTESGAVMGTPDYLAPEQARQSHEVDIRADLYSLGCMLYFLLTGKAPFPGGSIGEKLVKHQLDEPVPVEELRPEVPPEVAAVVRRLMAKKPDERYQTPAELEQVLRTMIRPAAVPAIPLDAPPAHGTTNGFASIMEPPSTAEAVDSPRRLRQAASQRRLRWVNLAGGGVLLGMLGLFFILLQRSGTATREPSETPPVVPSLPAGGSPLDALRREQISAYELAMAGGGDPKRAPKDLVAILGDSRLKHWQNVNSVAFHPAGGFLASGGHEHMVRIWDLETGQEIRALRCSGLVLCVAYSPDGRHVVSGGYAPTELKVWDAGTGQLGHALPGHEDRVVGVAFRPDGKQLDSASKDKTVKVWDVEKGKLLFTLSGHTDGVKTVAYSPDGKQLATGGDDKTIKLWDADQGGPALATLQGHTDRISSVIYSPDGKCLASGGNDRAVRLWDVDTRQEVQSLIKSGAMITRLAFSPDGTQLAMAGHSEDIVRLLEVRSGKVIRVFDKGKAKFPTMAFTKDGRRLAAGADDGAVKVWDVATGRLLQTPSGHYGIISQLAVSPDQGTLASSSLDATVRLWYLDSIKVSVRNLATGEEIAALPFRKSYYGTVAYSPDGRLLAACESLGKLVVFDTATGNPRHEWQLPGVVRSLLFDATSRYLLTGNGNGTIYVLRLAPPPEK